MHNTLDYWIIVIKNGREFYAKHQANFQRKRKIEKLFL